MQSVIENNKKSGENQVASPNLLPPWLPATDTTDRPSSVSIKVLSSLVSEEKPSGLCLRVRVNDFRTDKEREEVLAERRGAKKKKASPALTGPLRTVMTLTLESYVTPTCPISL